jgi:hypothetical protein
VKKRLRLVETEVGFSLPALFAVLFVLAITSPVSGSCTVPHYRMARTLEDNALSVSFHISIRLEDFAPLRLACLADALRQKYPNRNVLVTIFSARDAAKYFTPVVERTPWANYTESKLHGFYVYNEEKREDYILLVPDGHKGEINSPLNTRIDLPLTGKPVCKLSMDGRCLLEFHDIDYPEVDGKTDGSGEVTVTGRIRRDGVLTRIAVVNVKADSPKWRSVFAKQAIQNLKRWHFESSAQEGRFRITYRFEITDSASPGASDTQFRLPDEVIIRSVRSR